jgi:hypothetical protein
MRCRFLPEHSGAVCYVGRVPVRAGETCDATAEEVARIAGLVPCDEAEAAAADFLAAIRVATPHNPETLDAPAPAPVKRGRKAKAEA